MEVPEDVKSYIDQIDAQFLESRRKRLSRFSDEWDHWSKKIIAEIRGKIDSHGPHETFYRYIIAYWMNISYRLELHHKYRLFKKQGLKKRVQAEGMRLKEAILSGNVSDSAWTDDKMRKFLIDQMLPDEMMIFEPGTLLTEASVIIKR